MLNPDILSIMPNAPLGTATDKLDDVLTGIALKSGLLQARMHESRLRSDLQEIEDMAVEAVGLLRTLNEVK